ncbi:hypothetical protein [Persicobacter sp. CCB-QB2]|uniref:hypothetical protein n=1 Tax=Persicobacter sp. CCB-QB2 TaxID=1561025 RepID=UPI0006A98467|nr:hypothetical protein [Persicobacter sp. CCB-QB2]
MEFDITEHIVNKERVKKKKKAERAYYLILLFPVLNLFGLGEKIAQLIGDDLFVIFIFSIMFYFVYWMIKVPRVFMKGQAYNVTQPVVSGKIKFSEEGYSVNDVFTPFDKHTDQIKFYVEGYKNKNLFIDGSQNTFEVKGAKNFSCTFQINRMKEEIGLTELFLAYYENGYQLHESAYGKVGRTYLLKGDMSYQEIQVIKHRHKLTKWV